MMWNWIKWTLKIGWVCAVAHIDQVKVGSNSHYHIRMIETRYYTNIKTGETRTTVASYWA